MDDILEMLKEKVKIKDESGKEWFDFFTLLIFISKYYPSLSGHKDLMVQVEWYSLDGAGITVTNTENDVEESMDFDGFVDVFLPGASSALSGVSEESFEEYFYRLTSDIFLLPDIKEFFEEYLPLSQRIFIYRDDSLNEERSIYCTDLDMLYVVVGYTNIEFDVELVI